MLALSLPGFEATLAAPAVEPRDYQTRALAQIDARVAEGVRKLLCVAPTGAGKSILIGLLARDAAARGEGVLVLQHRRELLDQNLDKILRAGVPRAWTGVIQGSDSRRNPGARIQVASVDTLRGWVGKRGLPAARWVIIDEAHRAAAASYQKIVAAYPEAVHLGFTATPWRLDGKGLAELYDDAVIVATIPELVAGGYLVASRCYSHPKGPDLSGVSVRAGEFVQEELAEVMRSSLLLGNVVEQYRARAAGRAAFGFAVDIDHAQQLAALCADAGIAAVAIHGGTDDDARARALADLRAGRVQIVWNCQLFTEGTDVPEVKAIILCRPTLSRALAFQMLGRGMRPAAHTGFADCVVLDHAGVLPIHGHPLEPQDYSLTATRKKGVGPAQTKNCPECGETVALGATACACGYTWEREERKAPVVVPGQLVEVQARPGLVLRAQDEEKLIREAFRKAAAQNAKVPTSYARAILERQLRRAPDRALFERVAIDVLNAKPKPAAPKPEWLRKALGEPPPCENIHREPDPPPPVEPFEALPPADAPRRRVAF
mgnify:FL=1